MTTTIFSICLALVASTAADDRGQSQGQGQGQAATADRPRVVIVVGAPGTPEYEARFLRWAGQWRSAAAKAGAEVVALGLVGGGPEPSDHDRLRSILADQAKKATGQGQGKGQPREGRGPLWIVLIGHGTYDGREAKFNLRGPDVTALELAEWLRPIEGTVAVLDCGSASGPFLNRLSGPERLIVTATRSGDEQNYARFGQYLAGAIADPGADLDKDGQVSLLEAFLTAAGQVEESYPDQSRLATEHPLLDDNGDKLGTPAGWFQGVRATRRAKDGAPLDGIRANQLVLIPSDRERALPAETRRKRDQLELAIANLRDEKGKLGADAYYRRLEPLMIELARIYRDLPASP